MNSKSFFEVLQSFEAPEVLRQLLQLVLLHSEIPRERPSKGQRGRARALWALRRTNKDCATYCLLYICIYTYSHLEP